MYTKRSNWWKIVNLFEFRQRIWVLKGLSTFIYLFIFTMFQCDKTQMSVWNWTHEQQTIKTWLTVHLLILKIELSVPSAAKQSCHAQRSRFSFSVTCLWRILCNDILPRALLLIPPRLPTSSSSFILLLQVQKQSKAERLCGVASRRLSQVSHSLFIIISLNST